jgi:hypothetical protein
MRRLIYAIILTLGCGTLIPIATSHASDIPVEGYELTWSDEFSGNQLDRTKWDYRGLGKNRTREQATGNSCSISCV